MATFSTEPPWNSPLVEVDRNGQGWLSRDWLIYFQKESAYLANLSSSNGSTNVINQLSLSASAGSGDSQSLEDAKSLSRLMILLFGQSSAGIAALQNQVASANANVALQVANLAFATSYQSGMTANAALLLAKTASNIANAALAYVYLANTEAVSAFTLATTANTTANLAYGQANAAYGQANSAQTAANTALALVFLANTEAVAAWNIATRANTLVSNIVAANSSNLAIVYSSNGISLDTRVAGGGGGGGNYEVDVYANGTSVLANANLNFNNTATVNISVTANGTTQANVAFNANTNAILGQIPTTSNLGFDLAVLAYDQANNALMKSGKILLSNIVSGNTSNISVTPNVSNGYVVIDSTIPQTFINYNSFTATTNQNTFTLSTNATSEAYVIVFINGVEQLPITDYTVSGNTTLTTTSNCALNDVVEARIFTTISTGAAGTIARVQKFGVLLGTANGPLQGAGGQTTLFGVPAVCTRGMVTNFVLTCNQSSYFAVQVTTQNGAGNTCLNTLPITSNTFAMPAPWFYNTDLGGDNTLYIAITNYIQQQNLAVTLTTLDVERFA